MASQMLLKLVFSPVMLSELCAVFNTNKHWLTKFLSGTGSQIVGRDWNDCPGWQSPRGGKMNVLNEKHYFQRSKKILIIETNKGKFNK